MVEFFIIPELQYIYVFYLNTDRFKTTKTLRKNGNRFP